MRLGCFLLSCLIIWPVVTILVVAYAPGSWVTGFLYGFGSVEAAMWLGTRYAIQGSDMQAPKSSEAAKKIGVIITRGLGTGLAVIFGGLTLLFLVFSIGLAWKGDFGPNLTGASMLFGFWLPLTQLIWNITRVRAT